MIANIADDNEVHGVAGCPDPDLITYWLADEIDEERGLGIRDDALSSTSASSSSGRPAGSGLRPRPGHLSVPHPLHRRGRHPDRGAGADLARARAAAVLPMCEQPVRTRPDARGNERAAGVPDPRPRRGAHRGVELEGIAAATPTPEVLEALAAAEAEIVGPSNPVISIGPILAVPMREAIADASLGRWSP